MILLDSNIIIALFDGKDVHHKKAVSLLKSIVEQRVYTLSVNLIEIYSVIAKRCRERKYNSNIALEKLRTLESNINIIWVGNPKDIHDEIVDIMIKTNGKLNYIDSIILKYCLDNGAELKTFNKNLMFEYEAAR
ncbi:MAG: PIN domain-containing protein [Nitrosopumilaceae archaeon]|nr:PIN domain-containing protein [Nitrosopumilaceae archaeon]